MSMKSVWLLGFLVLALAFAGFANTADALLIDDIKIEAHDADNEPDNQYSIRLVRVTVEGELDESERALLGAVFVCVDEDADGYIDAGEKVIEIKTGDIKLGGHDLRVANDTHIVSSGGHDRIESNRDGEFLFVFVLPANVLPDGQKVTDDVSLILFFDLLDAETDLDPAIYDADLYGTLPADAGSRDFEFAVQIPHLVEGEVDDDVYRNGDAVEVRLEYETPDIGMPPLSEGEEIELLTLLPDFSNVDSRFALGNSEDAGVPLTVLPPVSNDPAGRYDLTSWDPSNTDPNDLDLYDLALDVNRAINAGRLIIDPSGGDYDVTYIISDTNLNSSGRKTLLVHAIDFPFVLDILDAPSIFTSAGLADLAPANDGIDNDWDGVIDEVGERDSSTFPQYLNIETWATCADEACYDDDMGNILLDNMAPNFDFAILDPFVNTPLRKLDVNTGEYAYVFKEGDVMRVMIQIDPHDLTEEELNEVDPDEVSPTGNERGTVSNITIIGDISALLDPRRADLRTDSNRNGIPDDAEVYTVEYAGSNGEDDDFDGGVQDTLDDDEDSTTNGINERFLYILSIEVDDRFRGVNGNPFTSPSLPIRFMIEDDSGNRTYLSTGLEMLVDYDNWIWMPIDYATWNGTIRDTGLVDGVRNPMYLDPEGEDEIFVEDGVYQYPPTNPNWPDFVYSSFSYQPSRTRVKMPPWAPGGPILDNWDQPFYVIIDAAYPNVSKIRSLNMQVTHSDPNVARGAAVIPPEGPNNQTVEAPTTLTGGTPNLMADGNFIYEITGNEGSLAVLEAYFPSDDDMYFVKFEYSDDGVNFEPMKGSFNGDYEKADEFIGGQPPKESLLLYDIAGNIMDPNAPGAQYGLWHDGVNGDDDDDNDADDFDDEVDRATRLRLTDGKDNDADGLMDMADRDSNNNSTEVYIKTRDEDEDGIMDEDEYVVPVYFNGTHWVARWAFSPLRMARVLDIEPGKPYAIRALAYDVAGFVKEEAAAPIYVVFNVTGPGIEDPAGDAVASLYRADNPGVAIPDDSIIPENIGYLLKSQVSGAAQSVTYQYSMDKRRWTTMPTPFPNPDTAAPFQSSWTPMLADLAADPNLFADAPVGLNLEGNGVKDPGEGYQAGRRLYIEAFAGRYGSLGKYQVTGSALPGSVAGLTFIPYSVEITPPPSGGDDEVIDPDITVIISDSSAPVMVIMEVGPDDNMSDGALVPVDKDIVIRAVGPLNITDVSDVVFEIAQVYPDGTLAQWEEIASSKDLTVLLKLLPDGRYEAVSKWDTTEVDPGRYDMRCVVWDNSGNSNPQLSPVVHVIVGYGKKFALIVDPPGNSTIAGNNKQVVARIYDVWEDKDGDGDIDEYDVDMDVVSLTLQYKGATGPWIGAGTVYTLPHVFDIFKADVTPANLAAVVAALNAGTVSQDLRNALAVEGITLPAGVASVPVIVGSRWIISDNKVVPNSLLRLDLTTGGLRVYDDRVSVQAGYVDWTFDWTIVDLEGPYTLRVQVEDDKGYVTNGIESIITISPVARVRAAVTNFQSIITNADIPGYQNPRVSMKIADEGTNANIWIVERKEVSADQLAIKVKLIAQGLPGTITPDSVLFQYKINPNVPGGTTDPKAEAGWVNISEDTEAPFEIEWLIGPTHPLANLSVDTLVYVRAVAKENSSVDAYVDDDNFVPFVSFIFQERVEPTCFISRIERDNVDLGDLSTEKRVTGGVLRIFPTVLDNHPLGNAQQSSAIAKVELFYKLCKDPGHDGDTMKWTSADVDTAQPFVLEWDVSDPLDVATGKYHLLLVATDQAGNKSANIWNNNISTSLIRLLLVDQIGPMAFVEKPEFDGGRLIETSPGVWPVWVSASSYEGCLEKITLWYNAGLPGIEIEEGAEEVPVRRIYQDLNRNGVWDPGEPFRWELPPEEGEWLPDIPGVEGGWVKIGEVPFVAPEVTPENEPLNGYFFYDEDGNDLYDVGEPVWKDKTGGNPGRFDANKRWFGGAEPEVILLGGPKPPDETKGKAFSIIPGKVKDKGLTCEVGTLNWMDVDDSGGLNEPDFIWVDLPLPGYTTGAYDCVNGGVGEPIVYASGWLNWNSIGELPPTNNTAFDLKVQACDKKDSAGKAGNCGPEVEGTLTVGNIVVEVRKVNGRNVWEGKYSNEYLRITGDTVEVVVRVWPEPISGADVQLWFRYDDDLNPGAPDTDYNGYPDNATRANSKWDGIDNDWDNVTDEEQRDKDNNDVKWGEVNVWHQAVVTGGTVVTSSKAGKFDEYPDKNWFEVTLIWDVSMLDDEYQYEFMPIVVDASGFGVNFSYSGLPWVKSDTAFPQGAREAIGDNEIIIDHQAPYTYTQVVLDTHDRGDNDIGINSWYPLNHVLKEGALESIAQPSPDDMIIRNNDGLKNNWEGWRKGAHGDDCTDETGETAYKVYDLQAKVVSIYGGLDFTKVLDDGIGGVIFQYSTDGGATWTDLGIDSDPDYISTFEKSGDVMVAVPMPHHDALDMAEVGKMIPYTGHLVDKDGNPAGGKTTPTVYVTSTQKIVVATFSLDNVDIASLPPTNGTEYMFRAITKDLPDVYSTSQNTTGDVASSYRDELVVENRVGDDKGEETIGGVLYRWCAKADQNFMRDVNWKLGVPFQAMPSGLATTADIFRNPNKDIGNVEYVTGPRDGDAKDYKYWVNNIVPEARVMRVYDTVFWSSEGGFDQVALAGDADGVHAVVPVDEHVLIEAVVNPYPGVGEWGTTPEAADDVNKVRFYTRPRGTDIGGWTETGLVAQSGASPNTGDQSNQRFTVRIDTTKLGEGEFQLMAMAEDVNGNMEPFLCKSIGEVIIRVEDLMGPELLVGGLALDIEHVKAVVARETGGMPAISGIAYKLLEPYLNFNFTDTPGLDLNNLGNALFPSSPPLLDNAARLPVPKLAGEWAHLYIRGAGGVRSDGVKVTVYDQNNAIVDQQTAAYAKDVYSGDTTYVAGKVKHTFTLSEQTALLYLPTWTEAGNNVPRFEHVYMHYRKKPNPVATKTGAEMEPDNPYFGDKVAMTQYYNSKGESIWKAEMNLEIGYTYFYYFVVDTVGDTWVIPDPRNLTFDEFLNESQYADFAAWIAGPGQYVMEENVFLNLPLVSKIWLPGTPSHSDHHRAADDELWSAAINLDNLPDGVYEIRIEGEDKAGFTDLFSKTVVVDRTPPQINAPVDIKVSDRVKAGSIVPLQAIIHDSPGTDAVYTAGVLFEMSRKGNTPAGESVWQYAISPGPPLREFPPVQVPQPPDWQMVLLNAFGVPSWLGEIALDPYSFDGWMVEWLTPATDQEIPVYIRAVPFDDALNVQVSQANQKLVVIDGAVPKAKVVRASAIRAGSPIEDGANGFTIYPDDKDVTLIAQLVANPEGTKGVTFQYSLNNPPAVGAPLFTIAGLAERVQLDGAYISPALDALFTQKYNDGVIDSELSSYAYAWVQKPGSTWVIVDNVNDAKYTIQKNGNNLEVYAAGGGVDWITIPAAQYTDAVRVPNAQGEYVVVWQVDFSQLAGAEHDQYLHVRAVAEDDVGNKDDIDTILTIMVLNDTKGPQAYIRFVDGRNSLSPHLAVTKRCEDDPYRDPETPADPGTVDIRIEAHNVAAVMLEYRPAGGDWTEITTVTGITPPFVVIPWDVAMLPQGKYELRVTAYDGDGNPMTEPDVVVVIVDHTEPIVTYVKTWVNTNNKDGFEGGEVVEADGVFRYKWENTNTYMGFKMQVRADATDPTDKVEAKEVVLQYFDRDNAVWKTVKRSSGLPAAFGYNATDDLWTLTLEGSDALGRLIPQLVSKTDANGNPDGQDGPIWLRAMATDYACNQNSLDKGLKLIADAHAPEILAVYSGSREYEGGDRPTRIPKGGDTVDLWAKVRDDGVGATGATFRIPASSSTDTGTGFTATALPVRWSDIDAAKAAWGLRSDGTFDSALINSLPGSVELVEEHGGVFLFHMVWTTPLNMAKNDYTYYITAKSWDKAGNESESDPAVFAEYAEVLVERDVTPPTAPEIRFLVTHAGGAWDTNDESSTGKLRDASGYRNVTARIFDEYCAPWYMDDDGAYTGDPVRKIIDLANPAKYNVFDTFNEWGREPDVYIDKDDLDTSVEIWVRTPELEFGIPGGTESRRQYEKYTANSGITPDGLVAYPDSGNIRDPKFLPVNYQSMGHDPGIIRVYMEIARDPNQDGSWDDADAASWIPMDNRKSDGAGRGDNNQKYRKPTKKDASDWIKVPAYHMGGYTAEWDKRVRKNQEPLDLRDVVRVPLYDDTGDKNLKGYAYYWVMGDDDPGDDFTTSGRYRETIWNTGATDDDLGHTLDPDIGRDGWYIVRTWAEDFAGNGNPENDPGRRNFGYAMVYVKNQDDIAPVDKIDEWQFDEKNITSERVVWEGWHYVRLRTRNNAKPDGYDWYFGNVGHIDNADKDNVYCKFFADVDFVAIQAQDPVTGEWVDIGFTTEPSDTYDMDTGNPADRKSWWYAWVDSTWVEDGSTKLRAVLVDNGGLLTDGYKELHKQHHDGVHIPGELQRRNYMFSADLKDIDVDNPRATVVLPASGDIVTRGTTITIQAVPFSLADLARNGHDVGRMKFYARRKSATANRLYDGPWIQIDAKDNDLDGLFGEDPVDDWDLDKDGKKGEDKIDQIDTNEPYLVRWTIPDWLVIDDPRTENDIEDTAEYYIVAVAGDSDTGPLSVNRFGYSKPSKRPAPDFGDSLDPDDIIWDNHEHIVAHTERYALVTVQDLTPPRTRILQVGQYAVPSETKIVVGRTVTVQAGDTEVVVIPTAAFPERDGDYDGTGGLLMPPATSALSGLYYKPGWTNELLWGGRYTAWIVPFYNSDPSNPGKIWPHEIQIRCEPNQRGTYEAEWRPNNRIQLMYALAEADGSAPAFPQSGQTWADTKWKIAEADAIDMDDKGNPGAPDWNVTNWVTGDETSGMPDGKYYITVVATDDVGHTTGIPVGTAAAVMPDMVEIFIDNHVEPVTLTAAELKSDGTLEIVVNNQMERGQPLVLYVDPKMAVEDLDKVTFMFKAKHDYDWTVITIDVGKAISTTQPYSVTLSPIGGWSGETNKPQTIALGNIYQFKAVAEDAIGNKVDSNIIELTVVDKVAEAAIGQLMRIDGFNGDEKFLRPNQINVPRLTGRVGLFGCTDADVVGVTFLYKEQGAQEWTEIEAILNRGFDLDGDGEFEDVDPWDTTDWLTDGIDNDNDGQVDELGECGYQYIGQQNWYAIWNTTTLMNGVYELAVVANTGDNKSDVSDILVVVVDHNAVDIVDAITDWIPKSGQAVGGWTRRQVVSQNPILDPDDKLDDKMRGEVDVCVTFANGVPPDLDMGIPTGVGHGRMPQGTALDPALSFEYKMSARPDIGDETIHDKTDLEPNYYWKKIVSDVVYDAASLKFCAVWRTVEHDVLNGYYDIRVRVVDEAGNIAYKVIAERVVVDNTAPDAMITSIDDDNTLTYVDGEGSGAMATDTEIAQNSLVTVRATAIDSLSKVAYVQFQVRAATIQSGKPLAGMADEFNLIALSETEWTDIGLATVDANPKDSYSLKWDTTGLWEGDYLLRVEAVDIVGNKKFSGAVKVTVVDTKPPIATIVGYHPDQLQFLHYFWPKKYWLDNIYAATICQADVQEVQIQYRVVGGEWITIGVPTLIPFEQLDTPEDKRDEVFEVLRKTFYPPAVAQEEAVLLAYDWTGLWGTTWVPNLPEGTEIQLRAIAKDWSGNVTPPELAPVLNARVRGGMVDPVTPGSGMAIEFTANLGGTGVGDPTESQANGALETYENLPTVVLTVDAPNAIENPTVLVLVELDTPMGLVYGGEIVEVFQEEGAPGRYSAALKGDELMVWIAGYPEPLDNYLELLRLGGKITAFATVTTGRGTEIATTSLTMNDLRVFPVTAELGTNGTVTSKDGVVKVMVPRAALRESYVDVRPGGDSSDPEDLRIYLQKAGLFITPVKDTPNTPRDQRLSLEPVGQAYNIQMLNGDGLEYISFRPGFEPKITIDYSRFDIPADGEALGFVSVRYWDPYRWGGDGRWANDDIINLSVDEVAKTITFNLRSFGYVTSDGLRIPHTIFSIVLEKSLGRINEVVFDDAYVYPDEPDMSYMKELDRKVFFRVVDPAGIDWGSIRVYVDGELAAVGVDGKRIKHVDGKEEGNQVFCFDPDKNFYNLTEGIHTLKIEAWDKVDAVDESNWQMLEKTVAFFIDRTPPLVVTHGAQRDNVRWFSTPEGATAAITIVDEGVGLSAADLQRSIFVDVFEHLVTGSNTPLRTIDQGNGVNVQRKVLRATSRPILEYADDYTPDGIDNETWIGIHDAASNVRHLAWRASYTIQMGQIDDGDTYEVVFYTEKVPAALSDNYNENAIYLYEDLTRAYLLSGGAAVSVSLDDWGPDEFFKSEIMPTAEADAFTGYYKKTFLVDIIGNTETVNIPHTGSSTAGDSTLDRSGDGFRRETADQFFVRNLVADTRGPVVELHVPAGVKASDAAATVSASATDDGSGIGVATLYVNGKVVDEVVGPVNNASLEYTFGAGEAASANEIKAVVVDVAGNRIVKRESFGVQEMDAPVISDMIPQGEGVADATPTIGAAYSDATGIDLSSVTLTLNGAVMTDVTVGESKVSYTPVKPLKAGVTYTVKVSIKDKAGVPAEAVWTFALETDAPVITDTTPTGVDETGTPNISAKYSDAGTGINKGSVKLMVDNKAVEAQVTESSVSYKPADVMKKGKHMATLTVADMAGNIAELTWEFNIEETPPAITNVEPSGTINDDMPIISARYSDGGTGIDVGSVTLSLNGEVVMAEVTGSQVSYAVKEPLKTGVSHIVTVTVADKAGNVGTGTSTFRLEGTAPSISNMSPTGTVQSVDVAISATYSDAGSGVNPSTAVMKLDGVVVPTTPTASGISYQATGLLNGDHTVHVEVADQFGNVGTRTWTFTVERTPPTISSVGPSGEISTATPVLTAAYDDAGTGVDVNNVVLSLNGHVVPATITATKASYAILTPLERGVTYNVTVQVADKAGNIASDSATFSLETTPPDVTATQPTGTVSEDDAARGVEITAKLSDDGSGVNPDSVMMWLDGEPVDGEASVSNVSYTVKGLAYGEHTVRLVVADMLGNVADETWKFNVDDSTPPTVTVVSPKQDDVVGVQPMIKISYADAGSGVDLTSISVKVDDNPVMASAMAPAPAGANVVSAGEASYEVKLGYGPHVLTVTVKDVAGNEATAEVNFVVEGDVLKLVKPHNYPNPFRGGETTITFGLSQQADITIRIYDFTATLVATVAEEEVTPSSDEVKFTWNGTTDAGDGSSLANGVYFCKVLAKTDSETKYEIIKIALVRE